VEAARANAAVNGVSVEVARADLRREPPPAAETVAANLLRSLLLELPDRMVASPPRALVVSGLLRAEGDEAAEAFGPLGLRERARREDGDWAALLLAR
jgi:ribosomal protein L11 methylase PrmA